MTGDSSEGAALRTAQPPGSQPRDLRAGLQCMPPATALPRPGMQACGRGETCGAMGPAPEGITASGTRARGPSAATLRGRVLLRGGGGGVG